MEELKLLIGMVKDLPQLAIWLCVLFFIYKTVIIGSIWGVLNLAIIKSHDALINPKRKTIQVDVEARIRDFVINNCHENLISQIMRIGGIQSKSMSSIRSSSGNNYIHSSDVEWLKEAITEKLEKESS